jgi:hypothetical protein
MPVDILFLNPGAKAPISPDCIYAGLKACATPLVDILLLNPGAKAPMFGDGYGTAKAVPFRNRLVRSFARGY